MKLLRMIGGVPDDPDDEDLNAICSGPHPFSFFRMLFTDVANYTLPALTKAMAEDSPVRRAETGWCGDPSLGLEITEVSCPETTAFPVCCTFQTHGLPGMTVKWNYELHYKGQLGFVVYRHGSVDCAFDSDADEQRFARIWRDATGKEPVFGPIAGASRS